MKLIAKNRKARLRKKLRVDEFQELGFDIAWQLPSDFTNHQVDVFLENFFQEVILPQELGFGGEGDTLWHGLVCTQVLGKCTDEQRKIAQEWLLANGAISAKTSDLYDIWWE